MDVLEQQMLEDDVFKNLSVRNKLINSLYHIDGVANKDICKIPKEDVVKGLNIVGKSVYMFSNLTRNLAKQLEEDLITKAHGKPMSVRAVQLVTAKVELTNLPIVNKIVESLDTLFDESLSLDEALDKAGLDLSKWKYPIARDSAMFKPYHKTGVGVDKTKPTYVYVIKYTFGDNQFLKFGITSQLTKRFEHSGRMNKNTQMEVLYTKKYKSGKEAIAAEKQIKQSIPCGFVDKEILRDGHTETCSLDCFDAILEVLNTP